MSKAQGLPEWAEVSNPETPTTLHADQACIPWVSPTAAPLDEFLSDHQASIRMGTQSALEGNPRLAEHLLLDYVSATESYFRSTFTRLIHLCPVSREFARTQTVTLLAASSYDTCDLGYAVLDGGSLANAKTLRNRTQQLLGFSIVKNSSVDAALEQFDAVCHLRHAAVHARGVVGSHSLAELGMQGAVGLLKLDLNFTLLQAAAGVCESLVRAYNRFVFNSVVARWIDKGILSGDWSTDRLLYQGIFEACYSTIDGRSPRTALDAYNATKVAENL
jgi:hypothetical protein